MNGSTGTNTDCAGHGYGSEKTSFTQVIRCKYHGVGSLSFLSAVYGNIVDTPDVVAIMNNFFSRYEPDPIGVALGTGYHRFVHSSGTEGLAKISGDRLDILAVVVNSPGKGQFRELIAAAKKSFRVVGVWEDFNPIVGPALKRYGFEPAQCVEPWGEVNKGWEWNRG